MSFASVRLRTHSKDGNRLLRELASVPGQEPGRVRVQAPKIESAAENNSIVSVNVVNRSCGLEFNVEATLPEGRRNRGGDLFSRSVLRSVCDKDSHGSPAGKPTADGACH
jgi:hypothetical protein